MNKKIIFIGVIVGLILIGVVALRFIFPAITPSSTVAFTLQQPGLTVDIFREPTGSETKSTKVASITKDERLTLARGDYYYLASGTNIAPASVKFTASDNRTLEINPAFRDTHLETLLDPELELINAAIRQSYPLIAAQYNIQKGSLYLQGQWYGTTLVNKKSSNKDPYDPYRIVLVKENGAWKTVTKPELIVSRIDYPGIPVEVLRILNQLDPVLSPIPEHKIEDDE